MYIECMGIDVDRPSLSRRACLLGAAAATAGSVPGLAAASSAARTEFVFRVEAGGGEDATTKIQTAIDSAVAAGGGVVHLAAGRHTITKTLTVASVERITIQGDGLSTVLLHAFDGPLLSWAASSKANEVLVRDFLVLSTGAPKSRTTPVIACQGGATFANFSNLKLDAGTAGMGAGIQLRGVVDTCAILNCVIWRASGIGIEIGSGSEVRIIGGRVVGDDSRKPGSIGLLLAGGNGGVHVVSTDLIVVHTGIQIGQAGSPSNREVFLTHATLDSSVYGLRQVDHTYTSISGCWAASSDEAQILIEETASGATLVISGGTIFNGGAYNRGGANHGLVVKAGTFSLNGVAVRHNKGTGILVGAAVRNYMVQGCRIHNNGRAAVLAGEGYQFTGNQLSANASPMVDQGSAPKLVANNLTI